jgi:hypothetical protein
VSLAALLLAVAPQAPDQDLAPTLRAEARVEARVATVEVGEPFTLTLVVRHAADDLPQVDPAPLEADPGWAVLAGGELVRLPEPDEEGLAITSASWALVALEPGTRELPAPGVSFADPGATTRPHPVQRGTLEVRGVLAPGEDEPRPPGGFLGLGPQPSAPGWQRAWPLIAVALGLVGLGAWIARRRRREPPAREPTPRERLAALESAVGEDPEEVLAAHVALARLLRDAVDDRLGVVPSGLTDAEWAGLLATRLGAERARPYAELLAECEPVKYGATRPTPWAARERVARARELAEGIDASQAPEEVAS